MQTKLANVFRGSPLAHEAEEIVRNCVHCGFCNATCPTYRLLGNELDSPRGRIYLIKQMLEADSPAPTSRLHLDRCLNCRACETTCPSGVKYGRLLDIGREILEQNIPRPWKQKLFRRLLILVFPYPRRVRFFASIGRALRPILPEILYGKLPLEKPTGDWPPPRHSRRMLVLPGCVQAALAANINAAAARVLDKADISLLTDSTIGCCGALPHHLDDHDTGLSMMRRAIDRIWPHVETGIEAIVGTASGCGATIKEYGTVLRDDPQYAGKAARISALYKDIAEVFHVENGSFRILEPTAVAFHSPCSLQHSLQLNGVVENLLSRLGFRLTPVTDTSLCCGSAGTYSILQPKLAGQLRDAKIEALQAGSAEVIATANIGCLLYLREKARLPVLHWIELLDGCERPN